MYYNLKVNHNIKDLISMDGILLKLLQKESAKQPRFWKLFNSIRQDLDRMFWCFSSQPWLGAPDLSFEDHLESNKSIGRCCSTTQLWRPGALGLYADKFGEEYFDFWAIEPTRDDPKELVKIFDNIPYKEQNKQNKFIEEHARIWMLYTDSSCWEIFAKKINLLDKLKEALWNNKFVEVYKSQSDQRGMAFGIAGLSRIWHNM
jgi:hypothetical protein